MNWTPEAKHNETALDTTRSLMLKKNHDTGSVAPCACPA